jgi:excisionase family DNA binding protein
MPDMLANQTVFSPKRRGEAWACRSWRIRVCPRATADRQKPVALGVLLTDKCRSFKVRPMSQSQFSVDPSNIAVAEVEHPLTVKDAAKFLGVSPQTVYLWVERKQIPHLRVMGRNIRFLRSDLEPFRASFKQEMENA